MKDTRLKVADLFCGAGGFSTGAIQAGLNVVLAIDHWRTAIYTHQQNHPETRHICARIDDVDPRNDRSLLDLDLLLASPECTHHSIARGGKPINDQKRATPWHVLVWAEAKRPAWICVENVREFRDWGPLDNKCRPVKARKGEIFQQWISSLEAIGYQVDCQLLNAADFGAATSRTRLFIVARRGRSRRDIPWPEITHPRGNWKPAWSIIDWSIPCPSIFTRKRPLAEKTMRRIEAGLRKFCGAAFQYKAIGRNPGLTRGLDETVPTIVAARENHAIVTPFVVCLPFITKYNGTGGAQPVTEPLDTITAHDRFGLAMVSLVQTMQKLGIVDIGFRMLEPSELSRAQGFPDGYHYHGTRAEQVRQIGNAVAPLVAKALCRTIAEARLEGES